MNILCIAEIIPIPKIWSINNFIPTFYSIYKNIYKEDNIYMVKPINYFRRVFKPRKGKLRTYIPLFNSYYEYDTFRVKTYPHFMPHFNRSLAAIASIINFYLFGSIITKIIHEKNIQIIHAHYFFPDGMLAYLIHKKHNIPYVLTTHNERKEFSSYYSRKYALKILKNAAKVTPINHPNFRYYKTFGLKNIEYIPLGFDKKYLEYNLTKKHDSDSFNIITVGELNPVKNIDKVIMALSLLKKKYNIKYTIVGRGFEKFNLQKLVRKQKLEESVEFLDFVENSKIPEILIRQDTFVMPSYFETFGRVYFEAMAVGLPVICARNSGIHGFFREGIEGLSVDHKNIEELAEKIELLINNKPLRLQIGENGKKLVSEYTWEKLTSKFRILYANSISNQTTT